MLSGQGLVSSRVCPWVSPLSAYRIRTPSIARNCGWIDRLDVVDIRTLLRVDGAGPIRPGPRKGPPDLFAAEAAPAAGAGRPLSTHSVRHSPPTGQGLSALGTFVNAGRGHRPESSRARVPFERRQSLEGPCAM